jgi:MscS family membrane protein
MKLKFPTLFRAWMIFLLITLVWSIWASAQTAENPTDASKTPRSSSVTNVVGPVGARYLTFGLDRVEILQKPTLFNEPAWKPITFLIYLLLAFIFSKFSGFIICAWLKKLASRTETKVDDLVLGFLEGPVRLIVFLGFLRVGLSVFDWSENAHYYISRVLIVIIAATFTYLALKVLNLLLDIWRGKTIHEADRKFDDQLFSVLRKSLNAFVIIVAVLVTAQNLGINITAAITSLSIGGLAVGLAAQDTLANLFGAVAVFMDKPFRVGDTIKLDGAEGVVQVVGMRSTRVRNPDGHLIAVPNKIMGNAIITNITERPHLKTTMNLVLSQQLPVEKVKRALALLNEIYGSDPMTEDVIISFNRFVTRHINIQIIHWWKGTDNRKYLAGMQALNLKVKEQFDAEGIAFA